MTVTLLLSSLYKENLAAFCVWVIYYTLKWFVILPMELYWIFEFYKMRNTQIVKKRNFSIWMFMHIVILIGVNQIDLRNWVPNTVCINPC